MLLILVEVSVKMSLWLQSVVVVDRQATFTTRISSMVIALILVEVFESVLHVSHRQSYHHAGGNT